MYSLLLLKVNLAKEYAVKGWQIQDAIEKIKPLMGKHTQVLPLLNGVEASSELSELLNSQNVLNGLCGIIAKIAAPGRIQHIAIDPYIKLGETGNTTSKQTLGLKSALEDTGINVEIPDDIQRDVWLKYIFIAPLSGVTAVTRATPGLIRSIPETRAMLHSAIAESIEVGKALGVALNEADLQNTIDLIDSIPADGSTSMQRDVEAGYPSELETQTGAIVNLAKQFNLPVPVNEFIYSALIPQEKSARSL